MKNKLNCVLLIDDDEPTNFLTRATLEEINCVQNIHVEQSGQAALHYLTKAENGSNKDEEYPSPELIFLDINMPAMNGWEFLERYSRLEKHHKANVIVVMLTTSLNPDDRAKAGKIPDVSGFEIKPLTHEKVKRILKKYFPEVACV
jgi:CheY-like chemotaxis protein